MRYAFHVLIVCAMALAFSGCGQKHSKKENRAVIANPVTPPGSQPGNPITPSGPLPGGSSPKCPIAPAYNPSKSYLMNLFRATQYGHPEVTRSAGLKERLALLDACKEERTLLQKNSR